MNKEPFRQAHVFVVDNNTFTVHSKFQFCGVVNPTGDSQRYGIYSDIMNLRVGDLVFFYQRFSPKARESSGFHGIYEIVGTPFFDTNDIRDSTTDKIVRGKCTCGHPFSPKRKDQFSPAKCLGCEQTIEFPVLPNRISIKVKDFFEKSVQDDYAYVDHTDYSTLWTMIFKKTTGAGRARSIMHLLPEEKEKLIRLLKRHNNNQIGSLQTQTYNTPNNPISLNIQKYANDEGRLNLESVLQAWVMQNIDKNINVLKDIVGPLNELEYFGAWVPYNPAFNTIDILCLHKRDGVRFKATVIELKKGKINQKAIDQVDDYIPWIAQLVTENTEPEIDKIEIQPVIIGFGKTRNIILPSNKILSLKYFSNSLNGNRTTKNITINKPRLLSYKVNNNIIGFNLI